jgi:hypothetical protein
MFASSPPSLAVINTEYTATSGQAFTGVERLRLANAGVARENIRQMLTELGALAL